MRFSSPQAATFVSLLGVVAAQNSTAAQNSSLPIVDLGYELHQASGFNQTGGYYNFSNIRYAAPPVGNLRFTAPQPPAVNRSSVQTGNVGRICPQAAPAWLSIATQYIPQYLIQGKTNFTPSDFNTSSATSSPPVQDPRSTEDCLFLDVIVPQQIFDNVGKGYGAPVLVWIYGGGYTLGDKSGSGNPAGLIARSETNSSTGVIYVSLNYRLGAFGWLSGPTFQSNGTANAGLLDQRMALEWIQANIHLFGGDPHRVTVFGESAGGGSIMHQITAYGGNRGPVPFQQAIPQSPGWFPITSNAVQENTFNAYLKLLNVSTIQEARNLSYSALQTANVVQVGLQSAYGMFTYGPVVDGDFVPSQPGQLLLHGQFDKSLRVMVGHNADEGLLFTSPFISNNSAFNQYITNSFPTSASNGAADYIENVLYPPVFDGSQNYTNQIARAALVSSEFVFTCNTNYLDRAYNNQTYAYFFTVPPALHGQDIPYTYYNGPSASVLNASVAIALQEYITSFAEFGRPVGPPGIPHFNMYGTNASVVNLNLSTITEQMDTTANARCLWWQKALYI